MSKKYPRLTHLNTFSEKSYQKVNRINYLCKNKSYQFLNKEN